jgi:hypothetical protein
VRNKAAEKAKHVHQQQQQQQGQTNSGSAPPQTISVITHAPPVITSSPHDTTTLQRTGSYSINGILGIAQADQHLTPTKRKREEPIGKRKFSSICIVKIIHIDYDHEWMACIIRYFDCCNHKNSGFNNPKTNFASHPNS